MQSRNYKDQKRNKKELQTGQTGYNEQSSTYQNSGEEFLTTTIQQNSSIPFGAAITYEPQPYTNQYSNFGNSGNLSRPEIPQRTPSIHREDSDEMSSPERFDEIKGDEEFIKSASSPVKTKFPQRERGKGMGDSQ